MLVNPKELKQIYLDSGFLILNLSYFNIKRFINPIIEFLKGSALSLLCSFGFDVMCDFKFRHCSL